MKLSILVPFRDADGTRTRAKDWILRRWAHFYPEAEIIVEPDDGIDPFCKGIAVNKAAAKATGDLYIVLDADTWVDPQFIEQGIDYIERGRASWVIPARRSLRLTQEFSEGLMALDPTGPLPHIKQQDAEQKGLVAGFCWMVPATLWWKAAWRNEQGELRGMDERIRGWGGEDTLHTRVLDVMARTRRLQLGAALISLWHTRPRQGKLGRVWEGQDRSGELEKAKLALLAIYATARTPEAMAKVLNQ